MDDKTLEDLDAYHSGNKVMDSFSEPFEDRNLSKSLFESLPSVFDDKYFGDFNRTVAGGAVDALDLGLRTIESGVKGSATAINEAKNFVTGQKDDRLKRDMLAFFESIGTGGATSGPMKLRQGLNQLIKSGKTDEAAKVMLAESDAFKGNNFKEVLATTAKREPSPARKMTDAEKKAQEFNFEKNFNLEDSKLRGTMAKRMQENEERIKAVTSNIEKTGYYDNFPRGSKFVAPLSGKEYTVIGYRASSVGIKGKKTLTNLHSKRTELIKSGELPKERKYFDGNDPKISANEDIYDDRFYQPKIIMKDKDGKIELFNYDFILHQDQRKKELLNKVMPTSNTPKVNILDSTKEVSPLDIGSSKYALDGNLKSNYTSETIKLFDGKLKNIKTAGGSDANKLIGVGVKDGTKVGIRKNLNSRTIDGEKGVLQTIHTNNYNGEVLSYQPYATVENVTFNVNQKHRQRIASKSKGLAVPEASGKFNMASVDGTYVSNRNLLKEGYDTEIKFNPAEGHLYIDVATGQAVKSADTATVIGNRVFANGVTYWKRVDAPKPLDASDGTKLIGEVRYKLKRGGLMARA